MRSGVGIRRVRLSDYLGADAEEHAAGQAIAWIKSLRHASVDGVSFRDRFSYLGDSLWWFAELYLHKERAVLSIFRAIEAATALLAREQPSAVWLDEGTAAARLVVEQLCAARRIQYDGPPAVPRHSPRWLRMDARSTGLVLAALASPVRPLRRPRSTRTRVVTFVHRAFWRGHGEDGSAESYIGPVLQALEQEVPADHLRHVGVGPSTNFRARKWWQRGPGGTDLVVPIERLTPAARLAGSSGLWMARHAIRRALSGSADLRSAGVIRGCDCWPLIEEALAGIALLQFPWSARAMDEAGAALDALEPCVALTYAEAGGWGRALALEARRRRIPFAGLQHGFIYRHWLNYLHEPDEMQPSAARSADRGFPRPDLTLVFDDYAARHLTQAGSFPDTAVLVTGSPRLDALIRTFRGLDAAGLARARDAAGAGASKPVVLLVTKFTEVRPLLPALLSAIRAMPDVQLAIKTHPAETPDGYVAAAAGMTNVRVVPAAADLAGLLRASSAVITVNSTVALDAMVLGLPALSIGLPNNLSPFVTMGAIAGVDSAADLQSVIARLVYDQEFRRRLSDAASAVVAEYRMAPEGNAARRCASAILRLAETAEAGRMEE